MDQLIRISYLPLLCLYLGVILGVQAKLRRHGANVCSYEETVYKTKQVSTLGTTFYKTTVKTCCSSLCWSMCERNVIRTKTKVMYRMSTVAEQVKRFYCCRGWTKESEDAEGCTKPTCSVDCQNGGVCSKPDACSCVKGFEGKYCQNDINECNDPRLNLCPQSCINTQGSYKCECKRGFKRGADGLSCEDIDECQIGACKCAKETTKCQAICINTPGSFSCSCPQGYEQRIPGVCEDRNECVENSSLCDHKCTNIEGGYLCSCFDGFARNNATGKCEDIDECAVNNGGCSHVCNNIDGGRLCSCPTGFFLGNDSKTCEAIKSTDHEEYICEDESKIVQCLPPTKIGVLYAMYGRLSYDQCKTGNYTTSNTCQFKDVLPYLVSRCDNQNYCFLYARTAVFDKGTFDPCPNTSKYLHFVYRCVKP